MALGGQTCRGGDAAALRDSIANLMKLNLPDDTYVVHGHGDDSLMENLKKMFLTA